MGLQVEDCREVGLCLVVAIKVKKRVKVVAEGWPRGISSAVYCGWGGFFACLSSL